MIQKMLDNKTRSAVACGQVASNPRVIGRNLTEIQVFLRPQYERTVGCAGNTILRKGEYPRRFQSRLETPGSFSKADHSSIDWRNTMTTTTQALYADTHPHELISRAQHKLELFNSLLCSSEEGGGVNLSHPVIGNGIYWLLDSIARELEFALEKLMEVKA